MDGTSRRLPAAPHEDVRGERICVATAGVNTNRAREASGGAAKASTQRRNRKGLGVSLRAHLAASVAVIGCRPAACHAPHLEGGGGGVTTTTRLVGGAPTHPVRLLPTHRPDTPRRRKARHTSGAGGGGD